jgi:serine protease
MRRVGAAATVVAAGLLLAVWSVPPASAAPAVPDPDPVPGFRDTSRVWASDQTTDTIIVTFEDDQADPKLAARTVVAGPADQVADAAIVSVQPITDRTVAVTLDQTVSRDEADRIGARAEQDADVAAAEPSTTVTPQSNDSKYWMQWDIRDAVPYSVKAESAWTAATGSGVVVGVIDTGMAPHSDLSGSTTAIVGGNVIAGYDFVTSTSRSGDGDGRDADPTDAGDYCATTGEESSWHGTHVAGTIAAIKDNGIGVTGIAPDASIEPLRVLGRCGGAEADIIAAVRWGAGLSVTGLPPNPSPASVLNMSLGGVGKCTTAMQDAIDAVAAVGVPVVVSAGNDSSTLASDFPANCRGVIRVTASTADGTLAGYSNYGDASVPATIAAPGGAGEDTSAYTDWIWSTANSGTTTAVAEAYHGMVGTSMAAPHVSAAVALLKQLDDSLTPARIIEILTSSAGALPAPCTSVRCGAGLLDVSAAVRTMVPNLPSPSPSASTTPSPTATPTATPTPRTPSELLAAVGTPKVVGTSRVGVTLHAVVPNVPAGASTSYRWLRSGKPISGAVHATYKPGTADYHKSIQVKVAVTLAKLTTTRTSAKLTVKAGVFTQTRAASISGTLAVGRTLKVKYGGWSPKPSRVTYRWLRDGRSISRATHSSYKLTKADRGHLIQVRVKLSRSRYVTVTLLSPAYRLR